MTDLSSIEARLQYIQAHADDLCVCGQPLSRHRASLRPEMKAFYGEDLVGEDGQPVLATETKETETERHAKGYPIFRILCADFKAAPPSEGVQPEPAQP
jgi:hypothetical protein